MPGPTTPVIKQQKQYGDQKALDSLRRAGSGLKQGNADILPTERRAAGRPVTTGTGLTAPVAPGIPPEHRSLMENFARSLAVAQAANMAASDALAGPWLRKYAQIAQQKAQADGEALRAQTPFFE